MKTTELTIKQAKRAGYRVISRKHREAARIERDDWMEYMASQHPGGEKWVKAMGNSAPDHYRRCYSTDKIIVPHSWIGILPTSH